MRATPILLACALAAACLPAGAVVKTLELPADTVQLKPSALPGYAKAQASCVACHSVSALNVQGGVTGPDLSKAYLNVADKHGVPVEDFLKKPTSAVMSSVLGANPLTDEERAQVLSALQAASGK